MTNKEYCFVVDQDNHILSPTLIQKGWYLIRKGRAQLKNKYPMVIQLNKTIQNDYNNQNVIMCGIDDGSVYVGIALVQRCSTYDKVLFKGTIEQRKDVKKLMSKRRDRRRNRRRRKRYRKVRFHNRGASRRSNRLPPTIKQKKDAILRVLYHLNRWVNISEYYLEDVCIDMRAMTDGYKPYAWQYNQSNRLDENLRKAAILRDGNKCQECGRTGCAFEVHHILAKKYNGPDTIGNLITLCQECHQKTKGKERDFEERYFLKIKSKPKRFDYAMHVMQGKNYLRNKISELGILHLTNGGDTANRRIELSIDKSHCNDAICITGCVPDTCYIKEWTIKPIRRRSKAKHDNVMGIQHKDLVSYTYKNGEIHIGYVTALYPELNSLNFQSRTKHCKKVNAKKCRLLWRYNKIYWLSTITQQEN